MISYRSSLKGAGNGSGDSGHTVTDGTTIYTQRPVLQFDSPLTVQDDSENEATKVGVETGAVVDFSEFELPSSSGNQSGQNNNPLRNYSTTEQIVGTWTDGKPLYERLFLDVIHIVNTTTHLEQSLGLSNIDFAFLDMAFARWKDGSNITRLSSLISAYGDSSYAFLYIPNIGVFNNDIICYFDRQKTGWSEGNCYICYNIRYTKTTDTPTS